MLITALEFWSFVLERQGCWRLWLFHLLASGEGILRASLYSMLGMQMLKGAVFWRFVHHWKNAILSYISEEADISTADIFKNIFSVLGWSAPLRLIYTSQPNRCCMYLCHTLTCTSPEMYCMLWWHIQQELWLVRSVAFFFFFHGSKESVHPRCILLIEIEALFISSIK